MTAVRRTITIDTHLDEQVQEVRWSERIENYSKTVERLLRAGLEKLE